MAFTLEPFTAMRDSDLLPMTTVLACHSNRIQARYANPFDSDPRLIIDLDRHQNSLMVRRAKRNFAAMPTILVGVLPTI